MKAAAISMKTGSALGLADGTTETPVFKSWPNK